MNLKKKLYFSVAFALAILSVLAVSAAYIRGTMTERALAVQQFVGANQVLTRKAQVNFKIQVQEWKNILLRGHTPKDYQLYLERFEAQELATQNDVKMLIARLNNKENPDNIDGMTLAKMSNSTETIVLAQQFIDTHKVLGERYREALQIFRSQGDGAHIVTDVSVRGIDRQPTEYLEQIVDLMERDGTEKVEQIETELVSAQITIYVLIFLTILISTWLIVGLTRKLIDELTIDTTTQLSNRRELIRAISRRLKSRRAFCLVLIDIDQFKLINEVCGHLGADRYLKKVSKLLQSALHTSNHLFRSNADEFIILIDELHNSTVTQLAETVREEIESLEFKYRNGIFRTTASLAIVDIDEHYESVESVFTSADLALQEAKESGRNRVVEYSDENEGIATRQAQMRSIHDLNSALKKNRLVLYKQKIEALNFEQTDYYEILVRLTNKQGDIISPGVFLPAAEKYNVANKIDRWVISNLYQYLVDNPLDVNCYSVNLSGVTLSDPSFIVFIERLFDKQKIEARRIGFEITESEAVKNLKTAKQIIAKLKSYRCKVALDDFGTGVSSFSYLLDFDIDSVKIDGAFIKEILDNPSNQAVVRSVVDIASTINATTVAEFVENEDIKNKLMQFNIDFGQGFGIHKPEPLI